MKAYREWAKWSGACGFRCAVIVGSVLLGQSGVKVGGNGKSVEIDGACFGGYVKPANFKEDRRDRRLAINQNGKRRSVVIMRERNGSTLPFVFKSEDAGIDAIRANVAPGSTIYTDEASHWDSLHAR